MNPLAAISTCLRKSFTFSGRASRAEFWWFQALRVVALFAFMVCFSIALASLTTIGTDFSSFGILAADVSANGTGVLVTGALILILLPASYSASVRRLHDRGHPGWPLWLVFVGALFLFYLPLVMIMYVILDPQAGTTWIEGVLTGFVDSMNSASELEAALGFGGTYFLISIWSIAATFGPLYFIFFSVQACLPSVETTNRHGPTPYTPSHNEVFQ